MVVGPPGNPVGQGAAPGDGILRVKVQNAQPWMKRRSNPFLAAKHVTDPKRHAFDPGPAKALAQCIADAAASKYVSRMAKVRRAQADMVTAQGAVEVASGENIVGQIGIVQRFERVHR